LRRARTPWRTRTAAAFDDPSLLVLLRPFGAGEAEPRPSDELALEQVPRPGAHGAVAPIPAYLTATDRQPDGPGAYPPSVRLLCSSSASAPIPYVVAGTDPAAVHA